MTQAFNLAQLANKVDTSGQLDASTGLANAVPVANGGTGLTSVGTSGNVLTSNGTAWVSSAVTIADGSVTPAKLSTGAPSWDTSSNFKFNSGYGSAATAYGCRAWVNFNGTGTVAIRASGNVSSITDNGTGDYTVNFTAAMPNANYNVVATVNNQNTNGICAAVKSVSIGGALSNMTTSAVQVIANNTSSMYDPTLFSVSIFR
jgi:hypothetical protein